MELFTPSMPCSERCEGYRRNIAGGAALPQEWQIGIGRLHAMTGESVVLGS